MLLKRDFLLSVSRVTPSLFACRLHNKHRMRERRTSHHVGIQKSCSQKMLACYWTLFRCAPSMSLIFMEES
ncbi:hypothetical protein PIB30_041112 [Stylosanthes scabra]|uniref:Uncharacterized protein n=1 Tax=Stylosanthes scabra TaxID=79078 RepID=A0ABU6QGA4_9FABA|nr:hypothetical protein [Stylosanthes scabra]